MQLKNSPFHHATQRVLQNFLLIPGSVLEKVASRVMILVSFVTYCIVFCLDDDMQQVLGHDPLGL